MKENPYREDRENLRELLKQYENLKNGHSYSFLDEEAFEKIIDYYQEKEDTGSAMEAAQFAIEQYPYSAMLLIKKADILLALRRYGDALDVLEQAALLDSGDINLYILKTDAYLALDQQGKAVVLLEEALQLFEGQERIELLFELADVYDDYEEFDKVFDCLKMILWKMTLIMKKRFIKYVSGQISQDGMRKVFAFINRSSMNSLITNWHGLILLQLTRD